MSATAEQSQHAPGDGFVGRLSEHLAVDLGDRVAAQDQALAELPRHVRSFFQRQPSDQRHGSFAAARPALVGIERSDDLEIVAGRR